MRAKRITRLVVTGGPSGGKTTLIETLQREFPQDLAIVTEAASVLYRGGFPRLNSNKARVHAQRAIYFVQSELEKLVSFHESGRSLLVCDRGSIDGAAYWPGGVGGFFRSLGTSLGSELKRYDWVLHLDTTAMSFYSSANNPVRTETHDQALKLNEKIKSAWAKHPQRLILPHQEKFIQKINLAVEVVRLIRDGGDFELLSSFLKSRLRN
ncbi:MAG: ATP-binding protein [Bdellovibrio sp.]